jgi:nitroreductase
MYIEEAITSRKSIRKYKPDAVPKKILREILQIAQRAPSAMNTQPWEFIVITGEVLDNIKRVNVEKLNAGEPMQPDHLVVGWPQDSIYRQRQVELGKELFRLMKIPRLDKEKREKWMERGFRYFDAPAAIIITADRALTKEGPLLDIGAVMQNICLAALGFGLGTCIEDQGVLYPEVVREYAGIPDSKRLIMAITIGYPDWDFPANSLVSAREEIDTITTWCGF